MITEPKDDEDEKPSSGGRKRKMEPEDDLEAMMDQELLSRKVGLREHVTSNIIGRCSDLFDIKC